MRLRLMGHVADGISSAVANTTRGTVAKREPRALPTDLRTTSWLKIQNPTYSPAVGRPELFERPHSEPRSGAPTRGLDRR
jgi:hypothetical protein